MMMKAERFTLAALSAVSANAAFTYESNGADWGTDYPLCGSGKEQSPIDLKDATNNADIKMKGFNYYDFFVTQAIFDPSRTNWQMALPNET